MGSTGGRRPAMVRCGVCMAGSATKTNSYQYVMHVFVRGDKLADGVVAC